VFEQISREPVDFTLEASHISLRCGILHNGGMYALGKARIQLDGHAYKSGDSATN
jgi:hypothetical protein